MKKFILYYSVPLLMLVIAIVQISHIPKGLTRWKGGGFGMYSEMHPDLRQVVVNDSLISAKGTSNPKLLAAERKYANYPKSTYLKNFVKVLDFSSDTLKIEVWQVFFDSKTQLLNKQIIHQDVYIKN